MHRLLVDAEALEMSEPVLPKEAACHLKVLRPKNGEEIELFDGHGHSRVYRYNAEARKLSSGPEGIKKSDKPRTGLSLFACITKGSRWDWTLEKATELGVSRIVPVISERTIVRIAMSERAAKRERWTRIAEDAARQSSAMWVPDILEPQDFASALALAKETVCFAGALTVPPSPPLLDVARAELARRDAPREVSIFVGPEGDFSPSELRELLSFARPASFGDLVLRAETACMFGMSVLRSAIDAITTKGAK